MTVGTTIQPRDIRNCDLCGEKLCRTQIPLFWRVHIERMAIDLKVARQLEGLSMLIGSSVIAEAMAPSNDLVVPLGEASELMVCDPCAMKMVGPPSIAELAEIAGRVAERLAAKAGT